MLRKMPLKWKLTLGALLVLVLVGFGFGVAFKFMIDKTDQLVFESLQARAIANAKAVASEITFEVAAGLRDEVKGKISDFKNRHKETHAVVILTGEKTFFTGVGAKVNIQELVKESDDLDQDITKRVKKFIVATTQVASDAEAEEENQSKGYVVYIESLEHYYAFRTTITLGGTGVALLGVLIILIGTYLNGSSASAPINKIVAAAQQIADGDLEKIDIQVTGSLETIRLASSIKSMAEALQKQVIAVKSLTKSISTSGKEVAGTMAHLASSASEQAAAVTETASTVDEMEQTGKNMASNANQIVDAAEKTTEASIRGRGAVETTNEIIIKIKEDAQDISEKSKKLLSAVEEVGNIIRSVNAIAEQSKILAVNASIEAAKAGEYGSGFAVVAQEVKDLAQQSKDATLQITGTLTAIRQAIETMVDTAQSGQERTSEGVKTIANAGAIMNDLAEAIRENSEFANMIATNIKQQTIGLTQIATSIEEINSTALENQNISRKISQSTNLMTTSFDDLTEMVGEWRTPSELENTPEKTQNEA